jgi:hypothetical protein
VDEEEEDDDDDDEDVTPLCACWLMLVLFLSAPPLA